MISNKPIYKTKMGFPHGSVIKNLPANAGDEDLIPGLGRSPGKGNGNPLQYSCLENSMDEKSLVGYSPQGHKESDTTERLHFTYVSDAIYYRSILKIMLSRKILLKIIFFGKF